MSPRHLEGDVVECGCYAGDAVKTVVDYLGGPEFPKNSFKKIEPGGILILDDDEWALAYRVFPLPTGQGLVIKR
jgi:hypothetical protein